MLESFQPDAVHIATEGPPGLAARNFIVKKGFSYTTSFHTKFPEYIYERCKLLLSMSYGYLRWFHSKAKVVLTPTKSVVNDLKNGGTSKIQLFGQEELI